jgi:hypothetical protein
VIAQALETTLLLTVIVGGGAGLGLHLWLLRRI